MNVLANILASLAVAILKWASARYDLKDATQKGIALEALTLANLANKYKADHPVDINNLPAALKLRSANSKKRLSNKTPRTPRV